MRRPEWLIGPAESPPDPIDPVYDHWRVTWATHDGDEGDETYPRHDDAWDAFEAALDKANVASARIVGVTEDELRKELDAWAAK